MRFLAALAGFVVTTILMVVVGALLGLFLSLPPVLVLLPFAAGQVLTLLLLYFCLVVVGFVFAALLSRWPDWTTALGIISCFGVLALLGRLLLSAVLLPVLLLDLLTLVLLLGIYLPMVPTGAIGLWWASSQAPAGGGTATDGEWGGRSFLIGGNIAITLVGGFVFYPILLGVLPIVAGVSTGNPLLAVLGVVGVVVSSVLWVALIVASFVPLFAPLPKWVKGVLGYANLLLPGSIPINGLGALFFLVDLALHPFSFIPGLGWLAVTRVSIRGDTASIVHVGGLCADLNAIDTAYDLGNFILIDSLFDPTLHASTEEHEVGHQLSLAAFGSAFHLLAWGDEFFGSAYAEDIADGNREPPPASSFDLWHNA